MKNLLYILLASAVIISCGESGPTDKKSELEKLRKEAASINDKIRKLQEELAMSDTSQAKMREVAVTEVITTTFSHYIEVQGKVDGDENVSISPEVPGSVMKVNVRAGDIVKKGSVLATMENAVFMKNLEELQSQRDFANTIYLKQKALWDQKIGTEVQYLSAKNNLDAMDRKLSTVRQQVAQTIIKSPINGVVDAVNIKIGQTVAPGMPVFRVVNFSKLKVKAEVAEAFISKIKPGDMVEINFPDLNKFITTKIDYSGQSIDPLNRTFNVEVFLSEEEKDLHPNTIAVLKIADYVKDSTITLPVKIVQSTPEGSYVFIATNRNGKMVAEKRTVTVGRNYNGIMEITAGLQGGEPVITSGFQDLADGQPVKL
jgi:membrane fusion protein (multidrug efflux system)